MTTPLELLTFPSFCHYPGCGAGPLMSANEVDEHVTEDHLTESVWMFIESQIRPLMAIAVPPAASASSENDSVVAARNTEKDTHIYIDLDEYQ